MKNNIPHFETDAIRIQSQRSSHGEHSTPVFLTSSYVFESAEQARDIFNEELEGNIYTRYSNPNNDEFAQKLTALEGGEDGLSTSSGMAAVFFSLMGLLNAGDHIIASSSLFGSTLQVLTNILPRWGIQCSFADINNPPEWEKKRQYNTKLIFAETPSNPGLALIDLEWFAHFARQNKLISIIDNCFATPYLQNPLKHGVDIVVHSATKFIDGQGRAIGGGIVGKKGLVDEIRFLARQAGPTMSPFNGWMLSKSLETLAVRMEKHCSNALQLAKALEPDPHVLWVRYPFLPSFEQFALAQTQMRLGGGLVTFELKGGQQRAMKFLNKLSMISLSSNLGDTRSIITNPATTTHSKLSRDERIATGITDGMLRMSVGLEHINDIIADIQQAIELSQ